MLTPETWISAAIERLMLYGVDSIRVDVLAKEMSVTRGSFYWHFKDRDELLRRVLKAWQDGATEALIAKFEEQHHEEPLLLVKDLLSLPFRGRAAKRAASIELAIRAWARSDETARQAVEDVDSRRIAYIAQVFSALGFGIKDARSRAFALYAYTVTESLLTGQGSEAQSTERSAFMEKMLLSVPK
ncbi:TetR family transcriptional regulator [Piscinibacter gummiphilus]|nr:TetR family transcriptional regulator [Piscinibacter gummiphilus]